LTIIREGCFNEDNIYKGVVMDDKVLPIQQKDDFFTILGNSFKLIGASWEALLFNLGTFVKIYFLPLIIFLIAIPFLGATLIWDNNHVNLATVALAIAVGVGLFILAILLSIASIITQLASVHGKKISFSEVIEQAQPFFWRFIGLGILSVLIIFVGFILLIIPGLIALVLLTFVGYVMIDKNLGVIDSLRHGWNLAKTNWKIPLALLILQCIIQLPTVVPVFGAIITAGLTIAYFCLPAILYTRITGDKSAKKPAK
jgi:hypothetical protein